MAAPKPKFSKQPLHFTPRFDSVSSGVHLLRVTGGWADMDGIPGQAWAPVQQALDQPGFPTGDELNDRLQQEEQDRLR